MKNLYPMEDGHTSDEDIPISQLTVYATQDGTIYFACDWVSESSQSIDTLGSIFYKLGQTDLLDKILKDLKAQCVLENKEQEFQELVDTISLLARSQSRDDSQNSVAVSPRNVTRL